MDIFSRSSHEVGDDEALKWAALEKLPTYNRLKKGLLTASNGEVNEIDVTDIGIHERKKVLERLVGVAEEDNQKFLLKLRERIDRYPLLILPFFPFIFFYHVLIMLKIHGNITRQNTNEFCTPSLSLNISRVGIRIPTIEVRFEHLNVEAEAYVGSRALPTFFNYIVNILEVTMCKF